jgi:serine O-acetyltransferase
MFELLRADLRRAKEDSVAIGVRGWMGWLRLVCHLGVIAVVIYRYGSWVYRVRVPIIRQILIFSSWVLRVFQVVVCQCSISPRAQIGPGFVIHNWGGVFIPPVKAGRNLYVSTGAVIGYAVKSIGDDVTFAVGAKAVGPIQIGNNVQLSVNAAVTFNVPDNSIVIATNRVVPRTMFLRNGEKEQKEEDNENGIEVTVHTRSASPEP